MAGIFDQIPQISNHIQVRTGAVAHGDGSGEASLDRGQRVELALRDEQNLAGERRVPQGVLVPEGPWRARILAEPLLRPAILVVDDLTVPSVRDDEIAPTRALPIGEEPVSGHHFQIESA